LENYARITDGDQATSSVMANTFTKAGLNTLVGNKIAFINMTQEFLNNNYVSLLPPNRTIIEILENVRINEVLDKKLQELRLNGYQFALDDMTCLDDKFNFLSSFLSFVKIDIAHTPSRNLFQIVDNLKGSPIFLIAEKVETYQEYRMCMKLGFDYFQGFFFCRPEVVSFRKFETSRLIMMQALAALQNPDINLDTLDQIISMDVTLGYRLLKLVNSGYYALPVVITSIRQAIALIGLNQLRNWLSILLMTNINNKPHELCHQALIRAKAVESFAKIFSFSNLEAFFLTGLLSILDALLDMPMREIVTGLNLNQEITQALLERKGRIGDILRIVEIIESGDWDLIIKTGLGIDKISSIYMDAIRETEILREVIARKPLNNNLESAHP
jgi:EAL and modified HD-GYP domain-containing signal transduction protein